MARFAGTHLLGLALRLVIAAACVLPLAGARAVAPAAGFAQLPAGPLTPVNEEDESEREESCQKHEQALNPRLDPRPGNSRSAAARLPVSKSTRHPVSVRRSPPRPTDPDPFRNGLGAPYRC